MAAYDFIDTTQEGAALIGRMTNPPRNLLNARMVGELSALADEAEANEKVRTLVLTGAADGVFITHYDVGELSKASDRAREQEPAIGLPEVRVGILPGAGGTQRMARLLGTAKALELMLLGRVLDAESAERIGLVHRAVEPARLLPEALELANELAQRPPLSIALIKRCVLDGSELPLVDGLKLEQEAFGQTMRSEDASRLMRQYLKSDRPLSEQ